MRKEIEVKAKVHNFDAIIKNLGSLGCMFSEPVEQKDVIFVDADYGQFDKFQPGKNILRIRNSGGKYIFTIKQPQSNEQDAIERESEISDATEMAEALKLMGYKEVVRIHKVRRTAKYEDYEICLDEVTNLGSFIEVEKITEDTNAKTIQDAMFSFLRSLGVKEEDRITQGYDTLMYLKSNTAQTISH